MRRARLGVALFLFVAACSAGDGSQLGKESGGSGDGPSGAGSGGGPGNNGSSGSGFNGEECGSSTFGNQVPGTLLIILDKSGSMSEAAGGGTKWDGTVAALNQMITAASPTLEVGVLPFPAGNFDETQLFNCFINPSAPGCDALLADGGCKDVATTPAVAIAALETNQAPISGWLSSNGPEGGTPTRHALLNGYEILKAHPSLGQRYALLITDGQPNVATPAMPPFPAMQAECGDLPTIEANVLEAANGSPSINTFVIGSPGSEPAAAHLSQLAVNGNTEMAYQIGSADFQADLEAVLQAIAGTISDCIFELPDGENVDPGLVNVEIQTPEGPVQIFKDPSHQDGWDYADATETKIQLFGPACELYKAQQGNTITIILGCETVLK